MPATLLLTARLALAAVFLVAGLAKLADREGTRSAASAFGMPRGLAGVTALLLPLAELAVAAALLPARTATAAAIGALVLLAAFVAGIARSLARGEAPDCRCFGQLHSSPAGWSTLVRNVALAALAGLVLVGGWGDPGPSAVAWLGDLEGAALAAVLAGAGALGALVGAAWVVLHVLRSHGRLLLRIEALERRLVAAGIVAEEPAWAPSLVMVEPAPAFSLSSADGGQVTLDSLLDGSRPLALLFTDSECGPCRELLPAVEGWQRDFSDALEIAVVSSGERAAAHGEHELDPRSLLLDPAGEVHELYGANGTPGAALIGPEGRLLRPLAEGAEEVRALVMRAAERGVPSEAQALAPGAPLPELELAALEGGSVALATLDRELTLLLFWNSDCGFCEQMRDEILAWERRRGDADPRLVVISSGDRSGVAGDGFSSLVLLDPDQRAGDAFGAAGTPMGVLISNGEVVSAVAAGRDAVLELAGSASMAVAL